MFNENEVKTKMDKVIESLESRLTTVRAGRANPNILNGIMVEYYGVPTPIQGIANISIPEARQLVIKPFDKSALKNIEKALFEANLGIAPTNNGEVLILTIPEHIKNFDIEYRRESVSEIINEEKIKIVKTNKSEYKAKALILASGRVPKKGNNEKITKLEGKGISYCAVCDAPFYKDKVVGIIGGGNSAFDEGLYISDFAKKLYMFIRSDEIKADEIFVNKAKSKENIEILLNSNVTDLIEKDGKLSAVEINGKEKIDVDGLFVYIGYSPSTNYFKDLNITDETGYIIVNEKMETKIPGIFAAGDIIKKDIYQIITAASDGSIAALSAKKYIKNLDKNQ